MLSLREGEKSIPELFNQFSDVLVTENDMKNFKKCLKQVAVEVGEMWKIRPII